MSKYSKAELAENKAKALETLRGLLKPGSKVYVQVASVSRSGMSRDLRLFVVHEEDLLNITWHACFATSNIPRDSKYGERVWHIGGCGMDMAFAAVYELSSALFPDYIEKCRVCGETGKVFRRAYNEAREVEVTEQDCTQCAGKGERKASGYALKKETL